MASLESGLKLDTEIEDIGLDLSIRMLYLLGFWQDQDATPSQETHSRYFGPRLARLLARSRVLRDALHFTRSFIPWNLMIFSALNILIVHPVDIYLSWDNKLIVLEDVYCILAFLVIFTSMATMIFYKDELRFVNMQIMSIYTDNNLEKGEIKTAMDKERKVSKVITRGFLLTSLEQSLGLILGSAGYYLPRRQFVMSGWYPYDKFTSPAYEVTLMMWAFEVSLIALVSNVLLSFSILAYLKIDVCFDILLYKLRNIRTISIENIRSRKKLIEANRILAISYYKRRILIPPVQVSDDVDSGLYPVDVRPRRWLEEEEGGAYETRPQGGVTRNHPSTGTSNTYSRGLKKEVTKRRPTRQECGSNQEEDKDTTSYSVGRNELEREAQLNLFELAELHQKVLRLVLKWADMWEMYLICVYIVNILLFALTSVMIMTADHIGFREVLSTFVWLDILGIYFLGNFYATELTLKAAAVSEALYACDWLEASPSFKRSMLIIMTQANYPLQIKPTGLQPLSRKNFAEVANVAYKMLASTRTMVAK